MRATEGSGTEAEFRDSFLVVYGAKGDTNDVSAANRLHRPDRPNRQSRVSPRSFGKGGENPISSVESVESVGSMSGGWRLASHQTRGARRQTKRKGRRVSPTAFPFVGVESLRAAALQEHAQAEQAHEGDRRLGDGG